MALFFSSLVFLLFLSNIIVLITRSRLSIAQVSSPFKWLDTYTSTPTLITEALRRVTSLQLCYSEVTAYTALAYSYWAGFHDAYVCLCHAH